MEIKLIDLNKEVIERVRDISLNDESLEPCIGAVVNKDLSFSFEEKSTIKDVECFEEKLNELSLNIVKDLDPYCVKEGLSNGMYSRTLFMPKGMVVTGAIHKNDYIDIMFAGDLTVKSFFCDGSIETHQRYKGLNQFDGTKGRKRVLVMHEDTIWFTVDKTNAKTISEAKFDIVCSSSELYKGLL